MEYCKYHPLKPASWYCPKCAVYTCDDCSQESVYNDERRCFCCAGPLTSMGSAYTAEPFWHHIKAIFRYPLTPSTVGLIVGVTLIGTLLSFLPIIGVVAMLLSAGIFTKYSFRCLEETANGNMEAPDIQDAYEGGLILILKMFALMLAIGFGGELLMGVIGAGLTGLLGMLVVFSIPAFLINYALTESMLSSVNPINLLRIITAIGMPYGIMIGFMFLMVSSVEVLSYVVISNWELLTVTLQYMIANYYMVVIFHMMGYVVFQYQEPLGFYAREKPADMPPPRSEADKLKAHISVAVKEGDYDKLISLYQQYLNKNPIDMDISDGYYEFILRSARRDLLASFADDYLSMKLSSGRKDQLKRIYKEVIHLFPTYLPEDGNVRYELAKNYAESGDFMTCIRLINGMHKKYKDTALLIRSYLLMAKALDDHNKPDHAAKCRQMVAQLQKKQEVKGTVSTPTPAE